MEDDAEPHASVAVQDVQDTSGDAASSQQEGTVEPAAVLIMEDSADKPPQEAAGAQDDEESEELMPRATSVVITHEALEDSKFSWKTLWSFAGPGLLMSMAYLDPGNLESDLQSGAYAGYSLLWVLMWSTVFGFVLQFLAAKLGVVTGKHLAQVCRDGYSRPAAVLLWMMTELAVIGADVQEVVGSAIAMRILFGIPLWAGSLITGLDTFSFMALTYFGIRKLEALFAVLISTMTGCFIANTIMAAPPIGEIAYGIGVPQIAQGHLLQAVSTLGAVIMPHNLYLHSALVQSRKLDRTRTVDVQQSIKYISIESALSLFLSFIINLAVVTAFAKTFYSPECGIDSLALLNGQCQDIGLASAGDALRSAIGPAADYVWAVGLLAAGQASTITGTMAGQFVMEGFLNVRVAAWKRTLVTRSIALVPAVVVSIVAEDNDTAADTLGEWLNVLQSVQLPFALLPVLHFTSAAAIMGGFVNGYGGVVTGVARVNGRLRRPILRVIVWGLAILVVSVDIFLVIESVSTVRKPCRFNPHSSSPPQLLPHEWYVIAGFSIFGIVYMCFIFYLISDDLMQFVAWLRTLRRQQQQRQGQPGHPHHELMLSSSLSEGADPNTFVDEQSTTTMLPIVAETDAEAEPEAETAAASVAVPKPATTITVTEHDAS